MKQRIAQIRHGQVPKGFKMTQLGIVLSDWDIVPIGDIGRIVTGSTPPTVIHDYYVGDRLFITPADFTEGIYVDNTSRTVSDSAYGVSRVIPPDSIYVVCIGATVGKTNMCRVAAICNQQINAIVPGNGFCNQFLYYCIDYFFNRTKARYVGSQTLPIVSKNLFSRVGLVLPPLAEQRKIAKILAAQDKVIELKEKRLAEKQGQKKYLMQQLLTGKKRLKGFNGEWEGKCLCDVCFFATKCTTGELCDYVSTENMVADLRNNVCFEDSQKERQGIEFLKGDILIANIRPYLKKVWKATKRGVCSADVLVLRPMGFSSEFLYRLIANDDFFAYVMIAAKGSKMPRGDKKHIMSMPIMLPISEKERTAISQFMNTVDKELALLADDLIQEKRKKKALMQLLLTGIVRVPIKGNKERTCQ